MKKFLIILSITVVLLVGAVVALVATGNLKLNNFSVSTSTKISTSSGFNATKSVEKPETMKFDNILIQKTAGNELKELVAFVDEYFAKIEAGEDEYIYNKMLHTGFYKQYSKENIAEMHKAIRRWGKVKSYDLDAAKISIKKDKDGRNYQIEMPVTFESATTDFSLQLVDENGKLVIWSFNFVPIQK